MSSADKSINAREQIALDSFSEVTRRIGSYARRTIRVLRNRVVEKKGSGIHRGSSVLIARSKTRRP